MDITDITLITISACIVGIGSYFMIIANYNRCKKGEAQAVDW